MADIWFSQDLHRHVVAGMTLTLTSTYFQGGTPLYVAGYLTHAKYTADSFGLDWADIVTSARAELGTDVVTLLNAALRLAPGAQIGEGR